MENLISSKKYYFMVVSFLLWFPHFIYVPILAPYMESLHIPYTLIGTVLGSYGLMQFIFRLPIGISSDLLKYRKPFIITGMFMSMCSNILFLTMDGFIWLLLARSFAGVAAASWVAFTVLFPSYYKENKVHVAMSSISFVIVVAQFLGMSFSGYIVDQWGWQAPFWIGGVFSVVGLLLSFFIYEPKNKVVREPIKLKELAATLREPALLKVSFLSIVAHIVIFSTMFGFTPTLALQIGFNTDEITYIVIAFMIPHAFATLFMGNVLVPRMGEWNALKIAFFLVAIFTLLIPIAQTKSMFLIVQGFSGFALGLTFPSLLGMSIKSIEPKKRATVMGAYQSLYAIGIFAGPFFTGIINSLWGINVGFYFLSVIAFITTLLVIIWSKK
ncbi:MFS transporter [Cerasibacillus sp. JNUCC 74]